MARKKLLLLGAGPTSSLIACNLQNISHFKDKLDIYVWEKSKRIGGRFFTWRSSVNPSCFCDLGAQYLTWSGQPFNKQYFTDLLEHKLIRELDTQKIPGFHHDVEKTNYVCTKGSSSVVEHFFRQAAKGSISITYNKLVTGITVSSNDGHSIAVSTEKGGKENFDIVITTIPVPQVLKLEDVQLLFTGNSLLKSELEKVEYSSRFALGLFYNTKEGPFTKGEDSQPLNFLNDPIIRYWSVENKKRRTEDKEPCAIVAHTSVHFGKANIKKSAEEIKDFLLAKFSQNIISSGTSPNLVECYKWKYSQVATPYLGTPGFVQLSKFVIASGDSFTRSGFEGCIESASKTVEFLKLIML